MSREKRKGGFGKFLLGAGIGAGLGILFAPNKGTETRKQLKRKFDEMIQKAKEIDIDEVKQAIELKVEQIKAELADLDGEKILKIAKRKAAQIKDMAEELVEYAIEKGTPILEKTANSIREKAIVVTKDVLAKLEKENPEKEAKTE